MAPRGLSHDGALATAPVMLRHETAARLDGFAVIAGVDEAGRGPLAGPVVAGAVVFPDGLVIEGLTDSKKLSEKQRDRFFDIIHREALAVAWSVVTPETIDRINILESAKLAMKNAAEELRTRPDILLIDGNQKIAWNGAQRTIVKGDSLSLSIAAGSVIAKVTRDRIMDEYAAEYPEYGFDKNKGYGSVAHRRALSEFGPCPIHRRTFRGVREYLADTAPQLSLLTI